MTALMNQRTLLHAVKSYREEGNAERVDNARQPIASSYLADRCIFSISAFVAAQPDSTARRGMTKALSGARIDYVGVKTEGEASTWARNFVFSDF